MFHPDPLEIFQKLQYKDDIKIESIYAKSPFPTDNTERWDEKLMKRMSVAKMKLEGRG